MAEEKRRRPLGEAKLVGVMEHSISLYASSTHILQLRDHSILTSGTDKRILRWYFAEEEEEFQYYAPFQKFVGHTSVVKCLAEVDDNVFVSGGYDGTMRIWSLMSGECIHTIDVHAKLVKEILVFNNSNRYKIFVCSLADPERLQFFRWTTAHPQHHQQIISSTPINSHRCLCKLSDRTFFFVSSEATGVHEISVWNFDTNNDDHNDDEHPILRRTSFELSFDTCPEEVLILREGIVLFQHSYGCSSTISIWDFSKSPPAPLTKLITFEETLMRVVSAISLSPSSPSSSASSGFVGVFKSEVKVWSEGGMLLCQFGSNFPSVSCATQLNNGCLAICCDDRGALVDIWKLILHRSSDRLVDRCCEVIAQHEKELFDIEQLKTVLPFELHEMIVSYLHTSPQPWHSK
eukprot:TRINITY_DN2510_c0_g1_i1.p1 TRINITY_DN2510_c0_g1~~TRINITY_DN2510_c0_g1_i1.p1  ORF type:complete len:405 (-),score=60.76 TRINITY_DN2510_c0_g1_i1:208-1422(-)